MTQYGIVFSFEAIPDSIPPSDRRWLLVGWSADFADFDVGLPTNTQVRCLYFANVGPTLGQRRIFIQDGGEQ